MRIRSWKASPSSTVATYKRSGLAQGEGDHVVQDLASRNRDRVVRQAVEVIEPLGRLRQHGPEEPDRAAAQFDATDSDALLFLDVGDGCPTRPFPRAPLHGPVRGGIFVE